MTYLLEGEANLHPNRSVASDTFYLKFFFSVCFLGNAISTSGSSWVATEAMTALGVADMSLILSFISSTLGAPKYFLCYQNGYAPDHSWLQSYHFWSLTLLDICYSDKGCNATK